MQILQRDDWFVKVKFNTQPIGEEFNKIEQKLKDAGCSKLSIWNMKDGTTIFQHTAQQQLICSVLSQLAISV